MIDVNNMDGKTKVLVLAIALAFVIGLTNQFTGNVSKQYIDKGQYYSASGESQCSNVGGESFIVGLGKEMYGKLVKLESVGEDISLVSVDGARRAMEPGMEKYVAGLYITVFATGTDDACLIVKDWE